MFIVLLTNLIKTFIINNGSNHVKCESLSNQKCQIEFGLINLDSKKYCQQLHYYPFAGKLDKCVGSCKILIDLPNKSCVLNKTEHLNIHVFNIITGKIESKFLTKDISCKCKCKFEGRKCNSNQKWNNDKFHVFTY